jgi:hypothetical protein
VSNSSANRSASSSSASVCGYRILSFENGVAAGQMTEKNVAELMGEQVGHLSGVSVCVRQQDGIAFTEADRHCMRALATQRKDLQLQHGNAERPAQVHQFTPIHQAPVRHDGVPQIERVCGGKGGVLDAGKCRAADCHAERGQRSLFTHGAGSQFFELRLVTPQELGRAVKKRLRG